MTDTDDIDVPAVPAPGPDAFTVVANLIALIADPREIQGRLAELKAQIDAAEKAMHKLERVREAHDRALAKDRAEIAEERAALQKRAVAVHSAEMRLADDKARVEEFHRTERFRNLEMLPGGGAREIDRSYARPPAPPPEDETELVPVPGHGQAHTLTQSVPKPRKSMRRVSPDA